ncbi:MAG: hypothetical protein KAS32_06500 [Candidatus Peribacteraceae bacterium]|nr:hypothetical protein [Candidatus Peribacteraceae bacterium]
MATQTKLFKRLDSLYDVLEGTDFGTELAEHDYPEAQQIQNKINSLLSDLEDIMPGLQAQIDSK